MKKAATSQAAPKLQPSPRCEAVIYHDYFAIRGGGERLVLTLAREMQAALRYGYRQDQSYETEAFPADSRTLGFPTFLRGSGIRPLGLAALFAMQRRRASTFKVRLFSGVAAPFAAPKNDEAGINVFYCHTPPRFIFDQRDHFLARFPAPARIVAPIALRFLERGYRRAFDRMDVIVANSETIRSRIARYLGRDSVVIYPPIETGQFTWIGQEGDYYLSTARLSSLKRVDRIVDAFLEMPDKKLVVVSGGDDADVLMRKAQNAPNIEFRGWVSDDELRALVGNAIATIYLPIDEDFGMSPVESMAAGKPVIGVAEGGLQETILPGETGILLERGFTVADLVAAVKALSPERAQGMRSACEARAGLFSREEFVAGIRHVIDDALKRAAGRD